MFGLHCEFYKNLHSWSLPLDIGYNNVLEYLTISFLCFNWQIYTEDSFWYRANTEADVPNKDVTEIIEYLNDAKRNPHSLNTNVEARAENGGFYVFFPGISMFVNWLGYTTFYPDGFE